MQKGYPVKIPLTVDLHILDFSGGLITRKESGATNLVYAKYADDRWYAMQRPGMNQLEDASATISDARGRGAYYWDKVGKKYICNANKVYQSSYAGTAMTITTGTQRVFMYEVGDYLVIIDQENNQGWTISSSAPTTITEITDTDFPPKQTPALQLARDGAVLNGKLYLMTTGADIYESDIEDPTSWAGLSFRNAEVEPDNGVILAKHHEHIVGLGTRTLEFFQDTANTTGSTLSSRTDIQYDVGAVSQDSLAYVGNSMYFAGQDKSGAVGIYRLNSMSLSKVSKDDMDTFLTSSVISDSMGLMGSGYVSGGREFYILSIYNTITDIVPVTTLVYVGDRKWWGQWDIELPGVDLCPLMAWMPSTTTRAGEGILVNGDLVTVTDDFNPVDTVAASAVFESGVFEAGVFTATSASGTNIPFEVITGDYDGGSPLIKKQGDLWLTHTPLSVAETVSIAVSDDQNTTYDTARTLAVDDKDARLNRMGSFRSRSYKLTGTLSEQIRMENIKTTARMG